MNLIRAFNRGMETFRRMMLGDALRAKAMRGGAWLGTGSVVEQVVRFGRNMLLARLLAPGDFGTMAIVLSSASLVDTLTDVGMRAAIIQNPRGSEPAYLNASWWIGIVRSAISYIAIFLLAPFIAHFYAHAELTGLLRVALLSVLFFGATSPGAILAQREMRMGRWALISNGGGVCGVILTVVLSIYLRSVWALAIGYCAENAFRMLLSYILYPGLPSLKLNKNAARDLLTFSRGIFGLAILNLIIARADVFVLGRMYPMASLGLYTLAVTLVTTPSVFLTNLLGQTLMPALSGIQNDAERINRILLEVTSWLLLFGMPGTVFVSLSAPSILHLVYGSRYAAAGAPLAVASAAVFVTVLNAVLTIVLFAKGLPGLHRHAVVLNAVIMLIAIYPAVRFFGPVGGQISALLAGAAGYVMQLIQLRGITRLNLIRYGGTFVAPALGSVVMLVIVLGGRTLGLLAKPTADMSLCVVSCLAAYLFCASAHLRASKWQDRLSGSKTLDSVAAR